MLVLLRVRILMLSDFPLFSFVLNCTTSNIIFNTVVILTIYRDYAICIYILIFLCLLLTLLIYSLVKGKVVHATLNLLIFSGYVEVVCGPVAFCLRPIFLSDTLVQIGISVATATIKHSIGMLSLCFLVSLSLSIHKPPKK